MNQKNNYKTASENDDGSFSIDGTEHKNLSYEELRKLQGIMGGHWITFRNYGGPIEDKPYITRLDFAAAL